jgi:SAM-dependent methyltransferase
MHDDGYFDERVAASYDRPDGEEFDPAIIATIVDFLVEHAGARRALELGIGTGRIALPLAQRGVQVHGIDLSRAMVARLRAKPGGDDVGVTIGDFATTKVDGSFSLAYLIFNTIMNLTTQAAQVACFRNVASHLEPGGCFVIEVGIPNLQRLPAGETYRAYHVGETRWDIDAPLDGSAAPVAHDVQDDAVRIADKEPSDAPRLVSQRVDDLGTAPHSLGVNRIHVRDLDGHLRHRP